MNKKVEHIPCLICNNDYSEELKLKNNSKEGFLSIPINVSICTRCGLVYLNPRWTKEEYNKFYSYQNEKYHIKNSGKRYQQLLKNAKEIYQRVGNYLPEVFNNYLDIGADAGLTLKYFKEKGKNISLYAIESSVECNKNLVNNIGAKIISNDAESDWYLNNEKKFGLITIRMTLEHLLNPLKSLRKMAASLTDDGILYISVPNIMNPKRSNSVINHYFRVMHTYYFSKDTLLTLTSKANLKPVVINDKENSIWGIFKKGDYNYSNTSIHKKQKSKIYKCQRLFYIDYFFYLPRLFARIIKKKIKIIIKR